MGNRGPSGTAFLLQGFDDKKRGISSLLSCANHWAEGAVVKWGTAAPYPARPLGLRNASGSHASEFRERGMPSTLPSVPHIPSFTSYSVSAASTSPSQPGPDFTSIIILMSSFDRSQYVMPGTVKVHWMPHPLPFKCTQTGAVLDAGDPAETMVTRTW